MRHLLIASLLLSPVLSTASAVASQPGTDAAASTAGSNQDLRVSTGVTNPKIVYSTPIKGIPSYVTFPNDAKVLLSFHIDEKGQASDFKVINPTSPILDEHVVDAVSKFRFMPATLDNQPIPIDMNWTVEVEK